MFARTANSLMSMIKLRRTLKENKPTQVSLIKQLLSDPDGFEYRLKKTSDNTLTITIIKEDSDVSNN